MYAPPTCPRSPPPCNASPTTPSAARCSRNAAKWKSLPDPDSVPAALPRSDPPSRAITRPPTLATLSRLDAGYTWTAHQHRDPEHAARPGVADSDLPASRRAQIHPDQAPDHQSGPQVLNDDLIFEVLRSRSLGLTRHSELDRPGPVADPEHKRRRRAVTGDKERQRDLPAPVGCDGEGRLLSGVLLLVVGHQSLLLTHHLHGRVDWPFGRPRADGLRLRPRWSRPGRSDTAATRTVLAHQENQVAPRDGAQAHPPRLGRPPRPGRAPRLPLAGVESGAGGTPATELDVASTAG